VRFPQLVLNNNNFDRNFGRLYGEYEEAELGQFPYVAHLDLFTEDGEFYCGASILDENTVVTAAHCVDGLGSALVLAGAVNYRLPGAEAQERVSVVFGAHEDFSFTGLSIKNDIAYMKLEVPFDFESPFVQPISIAAREPAVGSTVTAIGYGGVDDPFGFPSSPTQAYVTGLTIIDDDEAKAFGGDNVDFDHFVCIYQAGQGTCGSFSGGPAIDEDNEQFGVIAFDMAAGPLCHSNPTCFTSIPYFRDWLKENADVDI